MSRGRSCEQSITHLSDPGWHSFFLKSRLGTQSSLSFVCLLPYTNYHNKPWVAYQYVNRLCFTALSPASGEFLASMRLRTRRASAESVGTGDIVQVSVDVVECQIDGVDTPNLTMCFFNVNTQSALLSELHTPLASHQIRLKRSGPQPSHQSPPRAFQT